MTNRTGQCICGAVSFAARNVTEQFHVCHCKMCQRWNGGPAMSVTVPAKDIDWTGLDHVARLQSSDWAERGWCEKCGSGVWYRITAEGPLAGNYEIPLGLFDESNGFTLDEEIFIDRKPNSYKLAGEHRTKTEAEVFAQYGGTAEGA